MRFRRSDVADELTGGYRGPAHELALSRGQAVYEAGDADTLARGIQQALAEDATLRAAYLAEDPSLSKRDALEQAANSAAGRTLVLASKAQAEATPKTVRAAGDGDGRRRSADEVDAASFMAHVATLKAQGYDDNTAIQRAAASYPQWYAAYSRASTIGKTGKRGA
jgi:hypothetical protein